MCVSPGRADERTALAAMGASLKATAVKSGFLQKSGDKHKSWHRRWFILSPLGVGYFESPVSPEPLGIILPSEISDIVPDIAPELGLPFAFRVVAAHRGYDLQASNRRDVGRWVSAFGSVRTQMQHATGREAPSMYFPADDAPASPVPPEPLV